MKLDAQESARVVVLEDPTYVYIHTLRAPEIGPDGKPVMTKDLRRGEEVDVYKFKFIGRHQCLGDLNTLQEGRGVDPDNCPMCEASVKTSIVDAPQRRFATHVAKYATKPGTFDVSKPFSAQIQLWAFTEGIFIKLVGFQKEFGDLRTHDLKLGPCTNKDYQKFDINIASEADWLKTEKNKDYVKEALEENRCEDVESAIAKRKDRKWVDQDLKTVSDAWKIANGVEAVAPATNLTADLSNLLGNGKVKTSVAVVEPDEDDEEEESEPVAPPPVKRRRTTAVATPEFVEATLPAVANTDDDEDDDEDEPKATPKSLSFDELINNI